MGNASGLYNLLRNVGGSAGIAIVNTLVTRHWQVHRADFARYITRSRVLQHPVHVRHGFMLYHVGPHLAQLRNYAMVQNSVDIQANVYAYVDVLRYMAIACVLCGPIVFFLRKVKKGAAPGAH
jgi:DHA2 family multidrug resistance protein